MYGKKYVLSVLLFLYVPLWAQQTRVNSELRVSPLGFRRTFNQPSPAVTVSIKGTALATIADATGNFTINVKQAGAVLVFTFARHAAAAGICKRQLVIPLPFTCQTKCEYG